MNYDRKAVHILAGHIPLVSWQLFSSADYTVFPPPLDASSLTEHFNRYMSHFKSPLSGCRHLLIAALLESP
jgi:hypothetical protein